MNPSCSRSADKAAHIFAVEKKGVSYMDSAVRKTAQGVCKNVVHEDVSLSAKVMIDPIVDIGPISTHCLTKPEIIPCECKHDSKRTCSFIVRQRICVEVPIAFGADTIANPLGIVCEGADAGTCKCGR